MNNSAITILVLGALGYYWYSSKKSAPDYPNSSDLNFSNSLPALPPMPQNFSLPQMPQPWEIQPIGNVGPDWTMGYDVSNAPWLSSNNPDLNGGAGGGGLPLVQENSGFVKDAPDWARTLAGQIVGQYFPSLDLEMVLAICKIESSFNPKAYRYEPGIKDASMGLMQTLIRINAQESYSLGYKAFPYPTLETLADPATAIYYGCAYLYRLSKKKWPEEEIVRAYNGGPGNRKHPMTLDYWIKYLKARGRYV